MNPELTLYYDGRCPFCATEMARLQSWNRAGRLAFVDIAADGFDPLPLGLDMAALNRESHARRADGALLVGIDSLLAAYTLVGRAWLVWPLRVRFLRPVLGFAYRGFARHRYTMSRWLGYRLPPRCEDGACALKHPFAK